MTTYIVNVGDSFKQALEKVFEALSCAVVEVIESETEHDVLVRLTDAAAGLFGVTPDVMRSPSRRREVFQARSAVMYVAYEYVSMTYQDIGRAFGGRDHSTVVHAVKEAEAEMNRTTLFRSRVEVLRRLVALLPVVDQEPEPAKDATGDMLSPNRQVRRKTSTSQRNKKIVAMHCNERLNFTEIGKHFGLSRERVRQIVRRAGITREESHRLLGVGLWTCRYCGKTEQRYHGRSEGAGRTCCTSCRKEAVRRGGLAKRIDDANLLDHLQDLARRIGYTPGVRDLLRDGSYSHSTYYAHFGSLRRAQELAGLMPNDVGKPGHKNHHSRAGL